MRTTNLIITAALTGIAATTILAPTANADPSRTVACAFYAEDTTYIDTGVGYAKNRLAAETYECPTHSAGSGSDPGYTGRAMERLQEFRDRHASDTPDDAE